MAYELQDFEKDVLQASNATPVVIDFWAEWCGPCRQLGPVMEKLAGQANGRWKLIKINTDTNPDIAVQFGVRGIPAVKMVYQQEIVAEFTGAQPEHLVRKWLQENLPQNGADDSDELLNRVKHLLGEGDRDRAHSVLEGAIDEEASDDTKIHFAMLLLPDRLEEAQKWIGMIEESEKFDIETGAADTVAHLSRIEAGELKPEGENDHALERYLEGTSALLDKEFERALQNFIECLQIDRKLDDDGARKACLACFAMLGEQHPLTIKYRRRFSMSLY